MDVDRLPAEVRCPVCACPIEVHPRLCPRCETPHHSECWDYAGGCAIFGCDSRGWNLPATREGLDDFQEKVRAWIRLSRLEWASQYAVFTLWFLAELSLCIDFLLAMAGLPATAWVPRARVTGCRVAFILLVPSDCWLRRL